MFFIDGLSFIQLDPYWTYYVIYKETILPKAKKPIYSVCAYSTTYEFWDDNNTNCKTRISQFLVLPPYQGKGFGKELLDSIYNDLLKNKKCQEITVEDPSYEFQTMRDGYDIRLIFKFGFFSLFTKKFKKFEEDLITRKNYKEIELSKKEIEKIQSELKLTKSRVFFIEGIKCKDNEMLFISKICIIG